MISKAVSIFILIVIIFIGQAFPLISTTHSMLSAATAAAHSAKPTISKLQFPINSVERKDKYNLQKVVNTNTKASLLYSSSNGNNDKNEEQPSSIVIETNREEEKEKNINGSYIVLAVLLITFASNQWSRQAMYYLCDFSAGSVGESFKYMNRGLDFSKDMYAALASLGFTLVFAT
eukprot:gene23173-30035_t